MVKYTVMFGKLKTFFFFPVANYFKLFAKIRLKHWRPMVIVVTGSSGKTTLLHLIESQFATRAKYSYHANSALGIPFDILSLHRKTLLPYEWFLLFLLAPFKAFQKPFEQKIYVVEADADRPNEAKFSAEFLRPDITLWLDVGRTHSANFEKLTPKPFANVDEAIAYEFGYFLENTTSLTIVNSEMELIKKQLPRTKAKIQEITIHDLKDYKLTKNSTEFIIGDKKYNLQYLLPKEISYSINATLSLLKFLKIEPDNSFSKFKIPPGRSSILYGIKNTMLIDSTYNANLGSLNALLNLFEKFPAEKKWVVLGDMLEQGELAKEEHEKLAQSIIKLNPDKIILIGELVSKYTYPKLKEKIMDENTLKAFVNLKDVLKYLQSEISGGEAILFKASQSIMLDAVVERILKNKNDTDKLCRREKYWIEKRKLINL
jgi:UDP-N-acetylmuramoyl-tripeptide--D-alanyl-D-alanine ligase